MLEMGFRAFYYSMAPLFLIQCTCEIGLSSVVSSITQAELYEYKADTALRLNETLTIQGRVRCLVDPYDSGNYLNIEWKEFNQSEYRLFGVLYFKSCNIPGLFYCGLRQDINDYDIYLNTTVVPEFSQSEWRLRGSYNAEDFVSNVIKLPSVIKETTTTATTTATTSPDSEKTVPPYKIVLMVIAFLVLLIIAAIFYETWRNRKAPRDRDATADSPKPSEKQFESETVHRMTTSSTSKKQKCYTKSNAKKDKKKKKQN